MKEKDLFVKYQEEIARKENRTEKKRNVAHAACLPKLSYPLRYPLAVAIMLLLFTGGYIYYRLHQESNSSSGWEISHASGVTGFSGGKEIQLKPGELLFADTSVTIQSFGTFRLHSQLNGNLLLLIQGPAILNWRKLTAKELALSMDSGILFLQTTPQNEISFTIKTPRGEYAKKGTVAKITVGAAGDIVSIVEGEFTVNIDQGKPVSIKSKQSFTIRTIDGKAVFHDPRPIFVKEKKQIEQFQSTETRSSLMTEKELLALYQSLQKVIFKDGHVEVGYVYTQDGKWYVHGTSGIYSFSFAKVEKIETLANE